MIVFPVLRLECAVVCQAVGHSRSGSTKSKSSVQQAHIQVEAERAALVARAESLKERHYIEEQVEKIEKAKRTNGA